MLEIRIDTANAAFESTDQIRRILLNVAKRVEEGQDEGNLRDINGNVVGTFDFDYDSFLEMKKLQGFI